MEAHTCTGSTLYLSSFPVKLSALYVFLGTVEGHLTAEGGVCARNLSMQGLDLRSDNFHKVKVGRPVCMQTLIPNIS